MLVPMRNVISFLFFSILALQPGIARSESFEAWLSSFQGRARAQGISAKTLQSGFKGVQPIERIIELDGKQPEGRITFQKYRQNVVTPQRIAKGRQLMREHHTILSKVGQEYQVQPQYIVALWGIETNFGSYTGGFRTIDALATLAYDGRRREFFEKELLNALNIIDQGHISADSMKGSWAGALGQNQFMPSSFLAYAQDYNKDGRRDIWGTHSDVFASSANYLSSSGWKGDQRWGRAVKLPKGGVDNNLIGTKVKKPLSFWTDLGVRTYNDQKLPDVSGMQASLVIPDDDQQGAAYLVYNNFHVLLKWNRSTYFATSVGLLADAIAVSVR